MKLASPNFFVRLSVPFSVICILLSLRLSLSPSHSVLLPASPGGRLSSLSVVTRLPTVTPPPPTVTPSRATVTRSFRLQYRGTRCVRSQQSLLSRPPLAFYRILSTVTLPLVSPMFLFRVLLSIALLRSLAAAAEEVCDSLLCSLVCN